MEGQHKLSKSMSSKKEELPAEAEVQKIIDAEHDGFFELRVLMVMLRTWIVMKSLQGAIFCHMDQYSVE